MTIAQPMAAQRTATLYVMHFINYALAFPRSPRHYSPERIERLEEIVDYPSERSRVARRPKQRFQEDPQLRGIGTAAEILCA